ncbi:hypothetical protein [Curtobacterium sp. S6]|uniref:hypothetical protein n=1 Tax=Curtobacterium sp. S6 TaxID=1479623 RepID=UPI0004AB2A22|nr:hypothetical protein [Curtobacterium sp. S6]
MKTQGANHETNSPTGVPARPGSQPRRSWARRVLSGAGATAMLALAGFGVMSAAETQAAGVKAQNYVAMQQPAVMNGEAAYRDRPNL